MGYEEIYRVVFVIPELSRYVPAKIYKVFTVAEEVPLGVLKHYAEKEDLVFERFNDALFLKKLDGTVLLRARKLNGANQEGI